jgi:hypothetical protein
LLRFLIRWWRSPRCGCYVDPVAGSQECSIHFGQAEDHERWQAEADEEMEFFD